MNRNLLVALVGTCAIIASIPFGDAGGLAAFIFCCTIVVYFCIARLRQNFTTLGLAFIFFALNNTSVFINNQTLFELTAIIGYLLAVAFGLQTFRSRVQRLEVASILETASVGLIIGMLVVAGQPILDSSATELVIQTIVALAVLFAASTLLGRSQKSIVATSNAIAIAIATVLQLFDAQIPADQWQRLWAVPVVPILFMVSSKPDSLKLQVAALKARRQFGLTQQISFSALLVLNFAFLITTIVLGSEFLIITQVSLGLTLLATISARFHLLIKQRDWSYNQEQILRSYSVDIISSSDPRELNGQTLQALTDLTEGKATVALVKTSAKGNQVAQQTEGKPSFKPTRFKPLRLGPEQTPVEAWFANYPNARTTIATQVPSHLTSSGQETWFVAALPKFVEADMEQHFQAAATQYGMAKRSQELAAEIQEQRANQRYNTLAQDSNDLVAIVDIESHNITFIGANVEKLIGLTREAYLGTNIVDLINANDKSKAEKELSNPPLRNDERTVDVRLRISKGETRWFEMSVRNAQESGLEGLIVNFSDINDRKLAAFNMRNSEARFRALVANSYDVSILADADLNIEYVSPNVESMFDFKTQDLVGTSLHGFVAENSHLTLEGLFEESHNLDTPASADLQVRSPIAEHRLAEVSVAPSNLEGTNTYVVIVRDVSAQRELERSLQQKQMNDELTGLLKRSAFVYETKNALHDMADRQLMAVFSISLRNFGQINDSAGFEVGDTALRQVAERLKSRLRDDDKLARPSGDEFAVASYVANQDEAALLAERLSGAFVDPYEVELRRIGIDASIGYTLTSDRNKNADSLLQQATVAMHHGKKEKSANPTRFEKAMLEETAERFELASELQGALDNNDFYLVYQPLINLSDNSVRGFEALMRWNHPEKGAISPGTFIPLAEQNGMIVEMGRWVLRQATTKLKAWQDNAESYLNLTMSVNLSARQLEDVTEMNRLVAIVEESGINKKNLVLELTETAMVADAAQISNQLAALRNMGIKIAIDDFGAGNQGFGNLKDMPFDSVKIDKKYIDDIAEDPALVTTIMEFTQAMGGYAVAEGIETPEQIDVLTALGCDVGQGFYLARPMPEEKLLTWMSERALGNLVPG